MRQKSQESHLGQCSLSPSPPGNVHFSDVAAKEKKKKSIVGNWDTILYH